VLLPKPSGLLSVGLSLGVSSLFSRRARPSKRLGGALTNLFGSADDLLVALALVLAAVHASNHRANAPSARLSTSGRQIVGGFALRDLRGFRQYRYRDSKPALEE
jgi:hypothetical protein